MKSEEQTKIETVVSESKITGHCLVEYVPGIQKSYSACLNNNSHERVLLTS